MRERQILFSGDMVRAILDGRKTQTRRVVKMPDGFDFYPDHVGSRNNPANWGGEDECGAWWALADGDQVDRVLPCPYGQPGDRLWVRETFSLESSVEGDTQPLPHNDGRPVKRAPADDFDGIYPAWVQPHYRATDPAPDLCCERDNCRQCRDHDMGPHWRPSIHMPRWASRITLEVTGVRVERLQAISETDAAAEGIIQYEDELGYGIGYPDTDQNIAETASGAFRKLWESINGHGSWDANPFVWVVSFKRITP